MPSKDYRIWLSDKAYIVVEFVMMRGQILSFVVLLMLLEDGKESNVARYDTAHGTPHLDPDLAPQLFRWTPPPPCAKLAG